MKPRKDRDRWLGVVALLLSQLVLMTVLVRFGVGATSSASWSFRLFALLGIGLLLVAAATYLLGSSSLWWKVVLWAISAATAILVVVFVVNAVSLSWTLLVPAGICLAVFAASVWVRASLEKRERKNTALQ